MGSHLFAPGKGWLLFCLLPAVVIFHPLPIQAQSPEAVSMVSAASYAPPVAPDSLATIFGTGFSQNVVHATLDASGQLPRTLDGITVEINQRLARLIVVSPNQINFLVPIETEVGSAEVVVRNLNTARNWRGLVTVQTVAPALFSRDATGRGPGAILNGVTAQSSPFSAETPENPGPDKRTRLVIFGTGVRFAGNARADLTRNVAANVRAEAIDETGKAWTLPVEFAGAAPGFFGLDQVNVVLPAEIDGVGILSVSLRADSSVSNSVTFIVRNSRLPQISFFQPAALPPGGELLISGSGFIPETPSAPTGRNRLLLEVPGGITFPAFPLSVSQTSLRVLIPPILRTPEEFYQGPLRVCAEVDRQKSCAAETFILEAPVSSQRPPGEVLLQVRRDLLRASVEALFEMGNTQAAASLQRRGEAELTELQRLIAEAVAGRPRLVTFPDLDGRTLTRPFDLNVLAKIESLLAANLRSPSSTLSTVRMSLSQQFQLVETCGLAEEIKREERKALLQANQATQKVHNAVFVTLGIAGLVACLLSGPGCALVAELGTVLTPLAITSSALLDLPALHAEVGANYLDSVKVVPQSHELAVQSTRQFEVRGVFKSRIPLRQGIADWVIKRETDLLLAYIESLLPEEIPHDVEVRRSVTFWVADRVKSALEPILTESFFRASGIPPGPSASQEIALSARSLSVVDRAGSGRYADITLPCREANGTITGKQTTDGRDRLFGITPNQGNLLLLDPGALISGGLLRFSVGGQATPVLRAVGSPYFPEGVVILDGSGFPSLRSFQISWTDPQGHQEVWITNLLTDEEGRLLYSWRLSRRAKSGTHQVRVQVLESDRTAQTSFLVIGPDLVAENLVVSPTTVQVGEALSFRFTVRNQGNGAANSTTTTSVRLSASASQPLTSYELLATLSTPPLEAGASTVLSGSQPVPVWLEVGTYYVWVIVDSNNQLAGQNTANDRARSEPITVTKAGVLPDLVAENLTVSLTTVQAGQTLSFRFTVRNQGSGAANLNTTTRVSLSASASQPSITDPLLTSLSTPPLAADAALTLADSGVANLSTTKRLFFSAIVSQPNVPDPFPISLNTPPLAAGASVALSGSGTVPSTLPAGTYYLWITVDANRQLAGQNAANDSIRSVAITVTELPAAPDLVPESLLVSALTVQAGQTLGFSVTVRNQGRGAANLDTKTLVVLNSSPSQEATYARLGLLSTPPLAAGASVTLSGSATVPSTMPAGTYYIWIIVDADEQLAGQDKSNDVRVFGPITVTQAASAGLTGTWVGTQQYSDPSFPNCNPITARRTWRLTQSGSSVGGTWDAFFSSPTCSVRPTNSGRFVQGTVSGTSLTLVEDFGCRFSGTFTATTITITNTFCPDAPRLSFTAFTLTKQ